MSRGARPLPAPVLGTFVAIALCGFLPLVLLAATPAAVLPAWPLALLSTIIAGARFAWVIGSTHRRLYEMTAWLFVYLFLGLAPLVQLREGVDPSTTPNLFHQLDVTALAIVLLFEICFIAGSFFMRSWDAEAVYSAPQPTRRIQPDRLSWMTVALLAVGVFYIARVGPAAIWASRADRSLAATAAIGDDVINTVLTALATLGLLVTTVAHMHRRREQRAVGIRPSGFLMWVSIAMLIFLVNPIGSPRFVLVTVYLGLLAGAGLFRSMTAFRWASIGSIAAMFLVFPVLDTFRFTTRATAQLVDPVTSLLRGDYDSYGQITNTAWYVEGAGITWGNQLLGVVLFWVPRSWWPAKPEDTGIFLATERNYLFSNLSAPLPSELFINFGWVGVIVGSILIGVLLRRLDAGSERRLRVLGVPTVLGAVVPFYLILLMRGSLLQAAANLAVMIVVWWLVSARPTNAYPTRGTAGIRRRPARASQPQGADATDPLDPSALRRSGA